MADASAIGGGVGAGIGTGVGAFFGGPLGAAAGASLGASLGGSIGGMFGKQRRVDVPDISGEIARISALYEQARQNAIANIRFEAGQTRGAAASNLAARGTLRSPVSEHVFGRLREATGRDIATASATIGAQEAGTTSQILQSLLGVNLRAQEVNEVARQERLNALFGGLGSIGSTLLMAGLNKGATRTQPGAFLTPEQRFDRLSLSGLSPAEQIMALRTPGFSSTPSFLPALQQALRARRGF